MKHFLMLVATCFAAGVLLVPAAQAQCPAQPLDALAGPWTFSTDGFTLPPIGFLASAGRFVATVGTNRNGQPLGILQITNSGSINGSPTRLEVDAGRFALNADCTGGTLTFNLSSRPVQFDFYFVNADEIVLVGSNNADIVLGSAKRIAPPACPAQRLEALAGTWVFSVKGFSFVRQFFVASAGRFVASVGTDRNGGPLGQLLITASSSVEASPVRLERDAGRFQVNANCTGGTLTFNLSSRPIQFDFFFAGANDIVMVGSNNGDIVWGSARRFGT